MALILLLIPNNAANLLEISSGNIAKRDADTQKTIPGNTSPKVDLSRINLEQDESKNSKAKLGMII